MQSIISNNWIDNLAFDAEVDGFHITIDVSEASGGNNRGPRPKPLLLVALSGCTGMDVVSILKKMRVEDYKLKIDIDADVVDEHPKVYSEIRMQFIFTGENLPQDKVINAVQLSSDKYCAVSAMLKKAVTIKTSIQINKQEVYHD